VEVPSAFARGVRAGVITEEQGDRALAGFRADLARWQVVELTREVVGEAVRLVWRHPLRAADAIQLGSALVFARASGQPLDSFIAFDGQLNEAARAERLNIHTT
jgi:predicted nucleic acid-binding protein